MVDQFMPKFNIFTDVAYVRKVALLFVSVMVGCWVILGFDSGVGMIEQAIKFLPNFVSGSISFGEWRETIYSVYGRTFHFSAFVIYGCLFYGLSWFFQNKLKIDRSRNIFYAVSLTLMNTAFFEFFWMGSFAHFHESRTILEWLVNEFGFLWRYATWIVLGCWSLFLLWANDGCKFRPDKKMVLPLLCLLASVLFWYFYPFPFQVVYTRFFPQTFYSDVYVQNDLLHLVNVTTKALFAFTQFYILSRFKRC